MVAPTTPTSPAAPTADNDAAGTRLLAGMLRAVERSVAYRERDKWTRPVVVRWATAWALDANPEDAERHRARLRAARWLAERGAGSVTYDKPPYEDRPRTIRVSAEQFSALEVLARAHGTTPLSDALVALRAAWDDVRQSAADPPPWWTEYENRITTALQSPVPIGIGITAERIVDEWPDWLDSLKAARGIAAGSAGYERVVSERLLGYSKRLADLRRIVAAHLQAADPRWAGLADGTAAGVVLAEYGVRRVAPALDVAGPICVIADRSQLDVSRIEGLARVPGQWTQAIAHAADAAGILTVTTVENETSAWAYVEECGGPEGLALKRELVVYTSGFAVALVGLYPTN